MPLRRRRRPRSAPARRQWPRSVCTRILILRARSKHPQSRLETRERERERRRGRGPVEREKARERRTLVSEARCCSRLKSARDFCLSSRRRNDKKNRDALSRWLTRSRRTRGRRRGRVKKHALRKSCECFFSKMSRRAEKKRIFYSCLLVSKK